MTQQIYVLYEDKAAGALKNYGPHRFVVQCVGDALGVDHWVLQRLIAGVPRHGNSIVRNDCTTDPLKLGRTGALVFAIYDFDRIHELVKRPKSGCKADIKGLLRGECPWSDRLRVIFLERNIETVLEAVCVCAPGLATEEQRVGAVERKKHIFRDQLLNDASAPSPSGRAVRDCVLRAVPSLAYLVQKLTEACAPLIAHG